MATDVSADAMKILKIFEEIFRRDKQIKADLTDPDEITRQRVIQIAPLFHDLKSYLDKLESTLKAEDEYLCDVFRRIKTTSKEKHVDLLAHRWQPESESVWTSVLLFIKNY